MVRDKSSPKKRTKGQQNHAELFIGSRKFKLQKSLLQSIKRLQMSTKHCIPRGPLYRVVREVLQEQAFFCPDVRIQKSALEAIQESAEYYLVSLFEDCNLLAAHARRITVMPRDMQLVLTLRKPFE